MQQNLGRARNGRGPTGRHESNVCSAAAERVLPARESGAPSRAAARACARAGRSEPAQALLEVGDEARPRAHAGLLEHEHPDPRRLAVAPELEGGRPGGVGRARAARLRSPAPRPEGREPRKTSVMCRFSAGTTRPPCRCSCCSCSRLPGGDRLDRLAGELQRAEEAHTLIPTHASGRRVTCLSRLGDESPHEVQRRDSGAAADRLAVAGEAEAQVALTHRP